MKKKLFLVMFMVQLGFNSYSQLHKLYLAENGAITDSAKAKSYLIYRQISDTAWFVKQYSIGNLIIAMGTYKDAGLSIQHGSFTYYREENGFNKKTRPQNYVSESGYFVEGKKNGVWISYFPNGMKLALDTYIDDQQNGLHETYNDDDTVARVRGYYLNDLKDGEWDVLSKTGKVINSQWYQAGKIVKKIVVADDYKEPLPPGGFIDYINDGLSNTIAADMSARIFVHCIVTKDGRLLSPSLSGSKITAELAERLSQLLSKSGRWEPAFDTRVKQYVQDSITFIVDVTKGSIKTRYSTKGNELWHQMNK